MLRNELNSAMKDALKKKEQKTLATIRLILAALKDRDIVARGKGNSDGISDDEVLSMLQSMIKQRRDSISMYEQAGRCDLAEGEESEIKVITSFMPKQLSDEEIKVCRHVVEENIRVKKAVFFNPKSSFFRGFGNSFPIPFSFF